MAESNQKAELFGRDVKTIGKHINNVLKVELDNQVVVAKFATTTKPGMIEEKTYRRCNISGINNYDCRI